MMRFFKYLFALPIALLLVVAAVANRGPVTVVLDPFRPDDPALSFTLPLFLLIFAALAIGIVCGGFATWLSQGRFRKLAKDEHSTAVRYQRECEQLRDKLGYQPSENDKFVPLPAPQSQAA